MFFLSRGFYFKKNTTYNIAEDRNIKDMQTLLCFLFILKTKCLYKKYVGLKEKCFNFFIQYISTIFVDRVRANLLGNNYIN